MSAKPSQADVILAHIRRTGYITAWDAAQQYNCLACHSRIADIRKMLPPEERVDVEHVSEDGKWYAIYRIVKREAA